MWSYRRRVARLYPKTRPAVSSHVLFYVLIPNHHERP